MYSSLYGTTQGRKIIQAPSVVIPDKRATQWSAQSRNPAFHTLNFPKRDSVSRQRLRGNRQLARNDGFGVI